MIEKSSEKFSELTPEEWHILTCDPYLLIREFMQKEIERDDDEAVRNASGEWDFKAVGESFASDSISDFAKRYAK